METIFYQQIHQYNVTTNFISFFYCFILLLFSTFSVTICSIILRTETWSLQYPWNSTIHMVDQVKDDRKKRYYHSDTPHWLYALQVAGDMNLGALVLITTLFIDL